MYQNYFNIKEMRIVTIVLIILAVCLIGYNTTKLNFESLFTGDSMVAIIGIVGSLCAILILVIFQLSKKIQQKINNNN